MSALCGAKVCLWVLLLGNMRVSSTWAFAAFHTHEDCEIQATILRTDPKYFNARKGDFAECMATPVWSKAHNDEYHGIVK